MPALDLAAARRSYFGAIARAMALLRQHEGEFVALCERLDRVRAQLRAAGYIALSPPS